MTPRYSEIEPWIQETLLTLAPDPGAIETTTLLSLMQTELDIRHGRLLAKSGLISVHKKADTPLMRPAYACTTACHLEQRLVSLFAE